MRSRNRQHYEKYGDLFFVTSTIVGFIELFDSKPICEIFTNALRFYQARGDMTIIGYIIMRNHFHMIVKTKAECSISRLIGNIKKYTSHQIVDHLERTQQTDLLRRLNKAALQEPTDDCRIWRPRFDCLVLTNEDTIRQKLDYIHYNPVRRNLVDDPTKWPNSSARNYAGYTEVNLQVDTHWQCLGYNRLPSGETPDGA